MACKATVVQSCILPALAFWWIVLHDDLYLVLCCTLTVVVSVWPVGAVFKQRYEVGGVASTHIELEQLSCMSLLTMSLYFDPVGGRHLSYSLLYQKLL